mmetsp:Transcript_27064/g.47805  ORF Transcript_27064/g.47805 Transcript_27064/m.47805 type:complete len:374 (+) Transcript_27064:69-1190(+)
MLAVDTLNWLVINHPSPSNDIQTSRTHSKFILGFSRFQNSVSIRRSQTRHVVGSGFSFWRHRFYFGILADFFHDIFQFFRNHLDFLGANFGALDHDARNNFIHINFRNDFFRNRFWWFLRSHRHFLTSILTSGIGKAYFGNCNALRMTRYGGIHRLGLRLMIRSICSRDCGIDGRSLVRLMRLVRFKRFFVVFFVIVFFAELFRSNLNTLQDFLERSIHLCAHLFHARNNSFANAFGIAQLLSLCGDGLPNFITFGFRKLVRFVLLFQHRPHNFLFFLRSFKLLCQVDRLVYDLGVLYQGIGDHLFLADSLVNDLNLLLVCRFHNLCSFLESSRQICDSLSKTRTLLLELLNKRFILLGVLFRVVGNFSQTRR